MAAIDLLEGLGCDPIEGMAMIAMDEKAELSLRGQRLKELAQYVTPKRKALELQAEGNFSLVDVLQEMESRRGANGDEAS